MRSLFPTVTVLTVAMACSFAAAHAEEECDILKFKDNISYTRDTVTNLAYISKLTEKQTQSSEPKTGISFLDIVSLDHRNAQKASSELQRILNINYSNSEKEWLLVSQLNRRGQEAYVECLKRRKDNFSVVLSDGASSNKEFFVVVRSHPTWAAPDTQEAAVKVIGGRETGDKLQSIRNQTTKTVSIARDDVYERTEISISVGNDSLTPPISLPGLPKTKYEIQVREAVSPSLEIKGGQAEKEHRLCIKLPNEENDAMIVPKTLKFTAAAEINNRGVIREWKPEINRIDSDLRQACTLAQWHLSTQQGHVKGNARISATVLKAVSVTKGTSVQGSSENSPATKP